MCSLMIRQRASLAHGFEKNIGEVDRKKDLIHAIRWDDYNLDKQALIKGGCYIEVSDKDGKKLIWYVVNDHVVDEGVEHQELHIRGFDFNLFDEEREGCFGDDAKELPYLLMPMK